MTQSIGRMSGRDGSSAAMNAMAEVQRTTRREPRKTKIKIGFINRHRKGCTWRAVNERGCIVLEMHVKFGLDPNDFKSEFYKRISELSNIGSLLATDSDNNPITLDELKGLDF
jgi:hypothetical protein